MAAKLTGRVVYPGDPGWDEARKNFNQRFDVQPRVVVSCQDTSDVVNALQWARENKVPLRARSGRHSYEGYSLVGGGLVIDVNEIDHVRVDRDAGVAEIGAGIYMLGCTERLGDVGVTTPLQIPFLTFNNRALDHDGWDSWRDTRRPRTRPAVVSGS